MPDIDEFMHIKLLDEEITGQDLQDLIKQKKEAVVSQVNLPNKQNLMFVKHYNWSTPFMISEVDNFTLQIRPYVRKQRLQEQMNGLNLQERTWLTKIMSESKYLKLRCKTDIPQANGSMFVVIEEEKEENCEHQIINESKHI